MPIVINRWTKAPEVVPNAEWSWPDHPEEMSDGEARMRVPRAETDSAWPGTKPTRIDEHTLATKYGQLLEDGEARIQQTTPSGDNLPRTVDGHLLGIKQEMATDLIEHDRGWPREVYDTQREIVKHPGPAPPADWGAANRTQLSAWLPRNDRRENAHEAVLAARALAGATSSAAASDIAWCKNLKRDDGGAIWHEAVARGRAVQGNPNDLRTCAKRIQTGLEISPEEGRTTFKTEQFGPVIDLYVPKPVGSDAEQAREELYAAARGSLCMEYGPPLSDDEKALDALAASIVTSRGTNGAGLGWSPPEPELLREAGRELQRHPGRLQELIDCVGTIERQLYPAWPQHERVHERTPDLRPKNHDPEPLDRERYRYHHEVERWREEHDVGRERKDRDRHRPPLEDPPGADRDPLTLPDYDPNPGRLPDRDPEPLIEPPPPQRAPTPNRDRRHELEPDRGGPSR